MHLRLTSIPVFTGIAPATIVELVKKLQSRVSVPGEVLTREKEVQIRGCGCSHFLKLCTV